MLLLLSLADLSDSLNLLCCHLLPHSWPLPDWRFFLRLCLRLSKLIFDVDVVNRSAQSLKGVHPSIVLYYEHSKISHPLPVVMTANDRIINVSIKLRELTAWRLLGRTTAAY